MASDDGFREIQLNGKQLVFLFMAGTIAVVVIFLCGVMVGRGVRNATPSGPGGDTAAAAQPSEPTPDAQLPTKNAAQAPSADAAAAPASGAGAAAANPTPATMPAAPPTPPPEDLSYYDRLEGNKAPVEKLQKPAPPEQADGSKTAAGGPSAPETSSGGDLAVQVGAYAEKGQADAVAQHLVSKGYPAYVVAPSAGGGVFRVRVGKYKEQREAEAMKRRLEKEEQFKPWITR